MAGFETLEIIIGIVFVYLLFSTLVTLLVEYASILLKLRANNLRKIVSRALDDDDKTSFSDAFYSHPMIKYLGKKKGSKPSYIGSDKFAKAVLDLIRTDGNITNLGSTSSLDNNQLSKAIDGMAIIGTETKTLLKSFAKEAGEDINEFGRRLESWFNETVERGQGWFNRKIKLITLIISLLVACLCNVDTLRIYGQLSRNSDLRATVADNASSFLKSNEGGSTQNSTSSETIDKQFQQAQNKLVGFYTEELEANSNMLAIGWDESGRSYFTQGSNWFFVLIGWLITAFAISLGAPFWFGLLNKLTALRSAGKGSSAEETAKRNAEQVVEPKPVG